MGMKLGGAAQSNLNFHAVWAASVEGHILQAGGWPLFYADKGNALYSDPHTVTDPYGHVVDIQPDDTNNIVVLNMDQTATQVATFSLNGATSGSISVWRKDEAVLFPDPPVKLATLAFQNGTFTYHLPPLSVTTFVLQQTP
jgi:hypothetical protein